MKQYHSTSQDSQVFKAILINTLFFFCEGAGGHTQLRFIGPIGIGIFKAICMALWRLLFPFTFLIRKSKKRFIFLSISSPDASVYRRRLVTGCQWPDLAVRCSWFHVTPFCLGRTDSGAPVTGPLTVPWPLCPLHRGGHQMRTLLSLVNGSV